MMAAISSIRRNRNRGTWTNKWNAVGLRFDGGRRSGTRQLSHTTLTLSGNGRNRNGSDAKGPWYLRTHHFSQARKTGVHALAVAVVGGAAAVVAALWTKDRGNEDHKRRNFDELNWEVEEDWNCSTIVHTTLLETKVLSNCGWRWQLNNTLMEAAAAAALGHQSVTGTDPQKRQRQSTNCVDETTVSRYYDFVILGHGNAGRSAVETLRRASPEASVAVVDPRAEVATGVGDGDGAVEYLVGQAVGLDPVQRVVVTTAAMGRIDGGGGVRIGYRHGVLIATGSRGAPPPHYLMDPTLSRETELLEWKPTSAWSDEAAAAGSKRTREEESPQRQTPQTPRQSNSKEMLSSFWMTPDRVRQKAVDAVSSSSSGGTVAILGSGWEAVELAVAVAKAAANSGQQQPKAAAILVMGSHGPVSHVLPTYLSTELAKRLRRCHRHRIELHDRTLVKYIAHNNHKGNGHRYGRERTQPSRRTTQRQPPVDLYTAKSYDYLDTDRFGIHLVVLAPDTAGPRGSAAVPTSAIPPHAQTGEVRFQETQRPRRVWYLPWSSLLVSAATEENASAAGTASAGAGAIVCYKGDSRIAVNAEMMASAAGGVYAAGSVATFPNPVTGHTSQAGRGVHDAQNAGRVAAWNMLSQSSPARTTKIWRPRDMEPLTQKRPWKSKDPLPVWRSDVLLVPSSDHGGGGGGSNGRSHLSEAGVQALTVGLCDSEAYATHGVWWTNHQSAVRRQQTELRRQKEQQQQEQEQEREGQQRRRLEQESEGNSRSQSSHLIRATTNKRRRRRKKGAMRPVYGAGVVYYTDCVGRIQGIMTWGLPFTRSTGEPPASPDGERVDPLNERLVLEMKRVIYDSHQRAHNGGGNSFPGNDKRNDDLVSQSRRLIEISLEDRDSDVEEDICFAFAKRRPLHRHTEVRSDNVRRVAVLNKKQQQHQNHQPLGSGGGVLGEDLFATAPPQRWNDDFLSSDGDHDDNDDEGHQEAKGAAKNEGFQNKAFATPVQQQQQQQQQQPVGGSAKQRAALQAWKDWNAWQWRERQWELNELTARPPKEDPLWIRKGDETRQTSFHETLMNAFHRAWNPGAAAEAAPGASGSDSGSEGGGGGDGDSDSPR